MNRQLEVIKELNSVVHALQQQQDKQLSIKDKITLERMDFEKTLGLRSRIQSAGLEVGEASAVTRSPVKSGKKKDDRPVNASIAVTELAMIGNVGDSKLITAHNNGFKKGMFLLIGAGLNVEMNKLADVGSLILYRPLVYSHPAKEIIRGYPPNAFSAKKVERLYAAEFCRGIIYDIILMSVKDTSCSRLKKASMERNNTAGRLTFTDFPVACVRGIIECSPGTLQICPMLENTVFLAADDGVTSYFAALSCVDIINMYIDIAHVENYHRGPIVPKSISLRCFLASLSINTKLSTAMHNMSILKNIRDSKRLFEDSADSNGDISLSSFISLFRPSGEIITVDLSSDDAAVLSLCFSFRDVNKSEHIDLMDVCHIFAELDGSCPSPDIVKSLSNIDIVSDTFSFMHFLQLRTRYASRTGAMLGGIRVVGRFHVLLATRQIKHNQISSDMLQNILPESLLSSTNLVLQKCVRDVISQSDVISSEEALHCIIEGQLRMEGLAPTRSIQVVSSLNRVVECFIDSAAWRMLLLTTDGILNFYSLHNFKYLYSTRIIWAEPKMSRDVENSEQFEKWLVDQTPTENERRATLLSNFVLSLPVVHRTVFLIPESELVVINSSAYGGSISIHSKYSFSRLYRVKSPIKLAKKLEDSIQCLYNDTVPTSHIHSQDCHGIISHVEVILNRGLLICSVYGDSDIYALSLWTGAMQFVFAGHSSSITTLRVEPLFDAIFSGSSDGSLRIWNSDGAESSTLCTNFKSRRLVGIALAKYFGISPRYRECRIVSTGAGGEVEVLFSDSTTQYINHFQLRSLDESKTYSNSPPNFNLPGVATIIGTNAMVYAINPLEVAVALGRLLGCSLSHIASVHEWIVTVQTLSGAEQCETSLILDDRRMTLQHFIRLLYDNNVNAERRNDNIQIVRSSRLLYGSHQVPIVGVIFCERSSYIVSVDISGLCCVWDPHAQASQQVNKVMRYPFSNVLKFRIGESLDFSYSNVSIQQMAVSSARIQMAVHFMITPSKLMSAMEIDLNYSSDDEVTKGLFFVLSNFDVISIPCSQFNPFIISNINCLDKIIACVTQASHSGLHKIYSQRTDLIRVIYCASRGHESMVALSKDLTTFGVISKGFEQTPSNRIQCVCFERIYCHSPDMCNTLSSFSTGTVLRTSESGDSLTLIEDFTNDAIVVHKSEVVFVVDKLNYRDCVSEIGPGCHVAFKHAPKPVANDEICPDMLLFKVSTSHRHCMKNYVVSAYIARNRMGGHQNYFDSDIEFIKNSRAYIQDTSRILDIALYRNNLLSMLQSGIMKMWHNCLYTASKHIVSDISKHRSSCPFVISWNFPIYISLVMKTYVAAKAILRHDLHKHPYYSHLKRILGYVLENDNNDELSSRFVNAILNRRALCVEELYACHSLLENVRSPFDVFEIKREFEAMFRQHDLTNPRGMGWVILEHISQSSLYRNPRCITTSTTSKRRFNTIECGTICDSFLTAQSLCSIGGNSSLYFSNVTPRYFNFVDSLLGNDIHLFCAPIKNHLTRLHDFYSPKTPSISEMRDPAREAYAIHSKTAVGIAPLCFEVINCRSTSSSKTEVEFLSFVPKTLLWGDKILNWGTALRSMQSVCKLYDGMIFPSDVLLENDENHRLCYAWKPHWKLLCDFIPKTGMLSKDISSLCEIFQCLTDRVRLMHDAGFSHGCLSPATIVVDTVTNVVHLLALPPIWQSGGIESSESDVAFGAFLKFIRDSSVSETLESCYHPSAVNRTNMDYYSLSACFFFMAFGSPMPCLKFESNDASRNVVMLLNHLYGYRGKQYSQLQALELVCQHDFGTIDRFCSAFKEYSRLSLFSMIPSSKCSQWLYNMYLAVLCHPRAITNLQNCSRSDVNEVRQVLQEFFDFGDATNEFEMMLHCLFHTSLTCSGHDYVLHPLDEICTTSIDTIVCMLDCVVSYYQCIEVLYSISFIAISSTSETDNCSDVWRVCSLPIFRKHVITINALAIRVARAFDFGFSDRMNICWEHASRFDNWMVASHADVPETCLRIFSQSLGYVEDVLSFAAGNPPADCLINLLGIDVGADVPSLLQRDISIEILKQMSERSVLSVISSISLCLVAVYLREGNMISSNICNVRSATVSKIVNRVYKFLQHCFECFISVNETLMEKRHAVKALNTSWSLADVTRFSTEIDRIDSFLYQLMSASLMLYIGRIRPFAIIGDDSATIFGRVQDNKLKRLQQSLHPPWSQFYSQTFEALVMSVLKFRECNSLLSTTKKHCIQHSDNIFSLCASYPKNFRYLRISSLLCLSLFVHSGIFLSYYATKQISDALPIPFACRRLSHLEDIVVLIKHMSSCSDIGYRSTISVVLKIFPLWKAHDFDSMVVSLNCRFFLILL